MRTFICRPFGDEVDLDDPKTYDYQEQIFLFQDEIEDMC